MCLFFGHCGQNTQTTKSMVREVPCGRVRREHFWRSARQLLSPDTYSRYALFSRTTSTPSLTVTSTDVTRESAATTRFNA